ncbi:MAG: PAS domain S-box protein [Kiritimatiellales bacterium]|nr:PAS domain S-box protein [Kiritimatiellales bacterium]
MMLRRLHGFLFGTLRGKLMLGVAAVHAVMMSLFIGDLTHRQRDMLLERQVEQATALSEALATSTAGWIAANDLSGLQELVESQRRYPELLFASLTDQDGHVLADTDQSKRGLYMLDLPRVASQTLLSRTPGLVDIAVPARIGEQQVGWVRIGIGQQVAGEKLMQITKSGIIYALVAIFVGSAMAWVMGIRLTRRLYVVQKTMDAVRSGNSQVRAALPGSDEAADIAREFNTMLDALVEQDKKLHASDISLRNLVENLNEAVFSLRMDGTVEYVSAAITPILGYRPDEVIGIRYLSFFHPDDVALAEETFAKVLAGKSMVQEYRMLTCDGAIRHVRVSTPPVQKKLFGSMLVQGILENITDRKRAEDALLAKMNELQLWQTATLGREGRIGALKQEVNALAVRLGQPPPYGTPESSERQEHP